MFAIRTFAMKRMFSTASTSSGLIIVPDSKQILTDTVHVVYPAINYHSQEIVRYHQKYQPKVNQKYLKTMDRKHKLWVDLAGLPAFLKKQEEENQHLMKIPKEIVFIGRSNVGKSSLINEIYGMDLSNVSKHPGTTKALHFYPLRSPQGYIVDTPGYGWAKMNLKMRDKWRKLIEVYLTKSTRISRVYCLINMEHGMKDLDFEFLQFVDSCQHNFQVVLNKSDNVHKNYLFDRTIAIGHQLKQFKYASPILHVSSVKTKFGIDFLRDSTISSFREFYSKQELKEQIERDKIALRRAEAQSQNVIDADDVPESNVKLPPPEEMYRLLMKSPK
jgi:GTP-binding protein